MARKSLDRPPEIALAGKRSLLPDLKLSVQYPCGPDDAPTRFEVRRWVRASCQRPAEVTVRFVDEAEGRLLNRDYRHKDYATNVLSFPYDNGDRLMGDLVLCLPVVIREAEIQRKPLVAHFAHLVVHGMLHLQGFDHERGAADAKIMEARECEILAGLKFSNPYR